MRIGAGLDTGGSLGDVLDRARALAASGVSSIWSSQIFGWDTLTVLALVGREVPDLDLGTAVVPIHPRHPAILAAQALTVQGASGGRLQLGLGLSHQMVVEGMWGLSFARPARYMSEYLAILLPLLEGREVSFEGEFLRITALGGLDTTGVAAPPVLVAALGPRMLEVAARQAAGTVTWMVGPKTLRQHIVPSICSAAERAGRPSPRVVVHLPVCLTAEPGRALERAARAFSIYGQLPSYRAMLDREGAAGPADVAIIGDEQEVARAVDAISEAGATEFVGAGFGTREEIARSQELLGELARR